MNVNNHIRHGRWSMTWSCGRQIEMRKASRKLAAVTLALCVLSIAGIAQAQQIRIVALGGSSTIGQGVSRADSYPSKLQAALRAKGLNVSVSNAGISGDTSAGGLARVDSVAPAGTHVAIVELGVNDRYQGIDAATTSANINAIVRKLRSRGTQVLVFGYRGSAGSLAPVASANGARHMPFGAFPGNGDQKYRVENDPQAAKRGYGHFNGAGYDVIVRQMLPTMTALIAAAKKGR